MHHHPVLQHSKSTGQLDVLVPHNNPSDNTKRINNNNNKSGAKFGLLIRTPRRRRANCITNQLQPEEEAIPVRNRSKSWESKSTWSGWRSLRKISDTLIDYALNEPYKGDSLFDDELSGGARAPSAVYRRRSELSCDAISSTSVAHRSKTVGHAQGVSGCPIFFFSNKPPDFRFSMDYIHSNDCVSAFSRGCLPLCNSTFSKLVPYKFLKSGIFGQNFFFNFYLKV